jgi:hypothetical protein
MSTHHRVDISTGALVGEPCNVPDFLIGLAQISLDDLSWADPALGFEGQGLWPLEITDPTYDPATHTLTDSLTNRAVVNGRKVVTAKRGKRALTTDELAAYRATLRAYAADARWQREIGGVTVAGVPVQTDRASQAMVNGAVALCDKVPSTVIRFKSAAGFVDLGAATMTAVAVAVGQHVQSVFATEATVIAGIEAGTITTRAQIDSAFSGD